MSKPYRSSFVRTTNGIKTHFIEAGEGEPIVMVHGGGPGACGEHNWMNNVPALAEKFHVYAIDLIGYGYTDKPAIEYSYKAKVDHVAGFIDALCLEGVRMVGNSMGSYVAIRYALEYPENIKKALLVATATVAGAMGVGTVSKQGNQVREVVGEKATKETMRDWLSMLLDNKEKITDDLLERRVRVANLPGSMEAQKSYRAHMAKIRQDSNLQQWYDISTRLPKVTFPLALVWGANDRFAPIELAEGIKAKLPNLTEYHLIDKSGHQVQNDQPEKFNEIALRFFSN
jgi:pimeloyl-ACP methyl ester carboxylesterase